MNPMLADVIDKVVFYFTQGGWVMPPLAVACLLIWFGIGYRASVLRRPDRRSVRRLIEKHETGRHEVANGLVEQAVVRALEIRDRRPPHLRRWLDDALAEDEQALTRYSRMVKSFVAAAPILGLLGTVIGMIETFESLGDMNLFSQSGGIAGGISQALFTTQLGLAVAIPGLLINGLLERRAREMSTELAQIKDILCGESSHQPPQPGPEGSVPC
jgi:biopolymer transport protein ExbB